MRIAQVAPAWFPVPPPGYGGIELVVGLLSDRLAARGHDVTLFACGGSSTAANLVVTSPECPDPALLGNVWFDAVHTLSAYQDCDDFDIIHDHAGVIGPALAACRDNGPPVVHTLHGPWTEPARRFYSLVDHDVHLVAISEAQRADNPDVRYAATVHNGIDLDAYPLSEKKGDYLAFIGRSNPDKGPAWAVEIAKRAGMPLKMIVKKNEMFEQEYWHGAVAPQLTDDIEVLEHVPHEEKTEVLGGARALLFPIRWAEPFGLVMTEAMACGTPVIATAMGAAVEVVADGVSGILCDSLDQMVDAVEQVDSLEPDACRAHVAEHFSADAMVSGYEKVFDELVN
jgi:glycosyltransferase involved in cell wall biosynthesis